MADSQLRPNLLASTKNWCARHPCWTLALLTVVTLLPFLSKPFNIDDPCYVWCAQQIQAHPADPYGFSVNWYGSPQPMWSVMENPPLDCYFIALAAALFGWSEPGIHLAFLLPAIAVVLGTFRLAQKFCGAPMFAAAVTLFTPVFLVSSTSVMCDVLMLAFWIWAVVFWVEGLAQESLWKAAAAGGLIALAVMTKYNGACLLPLLAAYGLLKGRRALRWLPCLLISVVVLVAYQIITKKIYGFALVSAASAYASMAKSVLGVSRVHAGLTALAFTGGCFATAVFFLPWLWRGRTFALMAGLAAAAAAAIVFDGAILQRYNIIPAAAKPAVGIQVVFWAAGGLLLLALAVREIWRQRDAPAALLLFWIMGVFCFSAFFNWTVNARSLLPMAPAAGILLARGFERRFPSHGWLASRTAPYVFAAGAALAFFVAQADFTLAAADRQIAMEVHARYGAEKGTLWFAGNWGYQFYMEQLGAAGVDVGKPMFKTGDTLAVALNNNILRLPDPENSSLSDGIAVPMNDWLTTSSWVCGAGFYAATIGPLPFAFGRVPREFVCVYKMGPAKTNSVISQP